MPDKHLLLPGPMIFRMHREITEITDSAFLTKNGAVHGKCTETGIVAFEAFETAVTPAYRLPGI